jgi:hypothetical protein
MTSTVNVFQKLTMVSSLVVLTACTSIAPLDPIIGDTGHPFSDIANSTDVLSYSLVLEIFPDSKSISGSGHSHFLITQDTSQVELKLDSRYDISKILVDDKIAPYKRVSDVITINLDMQKKFGDSVDVEIHYSGKPYTALRAP